MSLFCYRPGALEPDLRHHVLLLRRSPRAQGHRLRQGQGQERALDQRQGQLEGLAACAHNQLQVSAPSPPYIVPQIRAPESLLLPRASSQPPSTACIVPQIRAPQPPPRLPPAGLQPPAPPHNPPPHPLHHSADTGTRAPAPAACQPTTPSPATPTPPSVSFCRYGRMSPRPCRVPAPPHTHTHLVP